MNKKISIYNANNHRFESNSILCFEVPSKNEKYIIYSFPNNNEIVINMGALKKGDDNTYLIEELFNYQLDFIKQVMIQIIKNDIESLGNINTIDINNFIVKKNTFGLPSTSIKYQIDNDIALKLQLFSSKNEDEISKEENLNSVIVKLAKSNFIVSRNNKELAVTPNTLEHVINKVFIDIETIMEEKDRTIDTQAKKIETLEKERLAIIEIMKQYRENNNEYIEERKLAA